MRRAFAWEIYQHPTTKAEAESDLRELVGLVRAAKMECVAAEIYQLRSMNTHTFLGSGKLESMREVFRAREIDLIVIDADLKPYQIKNIEDYFNIEVADRTRVILEIFKRRATSKEGKLQVELAEAEYEIGRQLGSGGRGEEMSKLGVGMRGPGEQIAEKRRRAYRRKIKQLKDKLEKVRQTRQAHADRRGAQGRPLVSLVGYTNAGKSTLLNALTKSEEVSARNQLFTTVDPTTRKVFLTHDEDTHQPRFAYLTDTVGFIRKLPHELVEGFESTLEMVGESDLVLVVVDRADPAWQEKHRVVLETLGRIGARVPTITLWNKVDQLPVNLAHDEPGLYLSADTGAGLDELKDELIRRLRPVWASAASESGA